MTPVHFTLNEDVHITVSRGHNLDKWPRFALCMVPIITFAVIAIFYIGNGSLSLKLFLKLVLIYGVESLLIIGLLFLFTRYFTIPRQVRRVFTVNKSLSYQQSVCWDQETISLSSEEGNAKIKFSNFAAWKVVEGHVMLYRSDLLFHILPASIFSDDAQRNQLIEYIRNAGVRER